MRTAVVLAGLLIAASPCAADVIEADSRVAAVTVFPDRAGVTRSAALHLPKGEHVIKIAPLPGAVEPDSVTARGLGQAEVTIYGVRLAVTQLETGQDPKVKALEEGIRNAMRRQQQLRKLKEVLGQERAYLASIKAASSEQIGKDLITKSPSASDAAALLNFMDEAYLKNFERDQKADEELQERAEELDRLQRELAELTQGRLRQETAILVDVGVRDAGTFRLDVSYRVPGASWQPSYEARALSTADEVGLLTYGLVRQGTGEDWIDAALTLSTAQPALAGSMPELEPWFLRPREAQQPLSEGLMRMNAAMEMGASEAKDARAQSSEVLEKEAGLAVAAASTQGPAVTYTLPKPATIPADWQPHRVPISTQVFKAGLAYETTPRLAPYAFLRAKAVNTSEALFLPGPVSVFLDGAYVATSDLKLIAPGEELDLFLGVDERVKVERKQLKERVEVSLLPGLRGKTKSTDYEFLTTIENFTGRRISVTAFDQVPVSQREEIVVESVQYSPPEVEKDPEKPGVFTWKLELAPTQKQELRLSYRVRYPVDMQVQ